MVVPPDFVPDQTSGDTMVPEGGNVKLTCKSIGRPQPNVTWRREDGLDILVKDPVEHKTIGKFKYSIKIFLIGNKNLCTLNTITNRGYGNSVQM